MCYSCYLGRKLIISNKYKKGIFLSSTIFLLLACPLINSVTAQGGGGGPLVFEPKFGPAGVEVEVTMNITDYLARTNLTDYASFYYSSTYSLVLDLGGTATPPDLNTVRTATWQIIGAATINGGQLHGTATIPEGTATGDHLITAVYSDKSSDAPYNYFWEWFEVKS
jgi:hypothetical protein